MAKPRASKVPRINAPIANVDLGYLASTAKVLGVPSFERSHRWATRQERLASFRGALKQSLLAEPEATKVSMVHTTVTQAVTLEVHLKYVLRSRNNSFSSTVFDHCS